MVRPLLSGLVLVLALVGCGARSTRDAKPPPPAQTSPFTTEETRILACLDLRDHIVDLYAHEYVTHEGLTMSAAEQKAFRDGWAEELAKRGTFEHFEQSCFSSLTPRKYRCGMESQTPGGLVACMKLSMR